MIKTIVAAIMSISGLCYSWKYITQIRKIIRLQTSKGVSRTYFFIGICYELVCLLCIIILLALERNVATWTLLILTIMPLVGNITTWVYAIKYAPRSHKKGWKQWLYRKVKSWV